MCHHRPPPIHDGKNADVCRFGVPVRDRMGLAETNRPQICSPWQWPAIRAAPEGQHSKRCFSGIHLLWIVCEEPDFNILPVFFLISWQWIGPGGHLCSQLCRLGARPSWWCVWLFAHLLTKKRNSGYKWKLLCHLCKLKYWEHDWVCASMN